MSNQSPINKYDKIIVDCLTKTKNEFYPQIHLTEKYI